MTFTEEILARIESMKTNKMQVYDANDFAEEVRQKTENLNDFEMAFLSLLWEHSTTRPIKVLTRPTYDHILAVFQSFYKEKKMSLDLIQKFGIEFPTPANTKWRLYFETFVGEAIVHVFFDEWTFLRTELSD